MPWNAVMSKFKAGKLHSGSKDGPMVTNPKQAVAIMMSERANVGENPDYSSSNLAKTLGKKRKKPVSA